MKSSLSKAATSERREYYKKWRAEHKEQVKQYNERYWNKKAEKSLQEDE